MIYWFCEKNWKFPNSNPGQSFSLVLYPLGQQYFWQFNYSIHDWVQFGTKPTSNTLYPNVSRRTY